MNHKPSRRSFLSSLAALGAAISAPLGFSFGGRRIADETVSLPVPAKCTGGMITISFGGNTVSPLPWNATPQEVQAAIEAYRAA